MKIDFTKTLSKFNRGTFTIKMRTSDDWNAQSAEMIARVARKIPSFGSRLSERRKELSDLVERWEREDEARNVAEDIERAFHE